ncbi:hypothetical protein OsI_21739 [Oryza sativa Indica Group]|uniref:SGNH hydrolase-type esterase domain-containing protein n=1 Tax=Oryza sativa subsp. indica TaxID=39946 RepID=A2Y9J4_ORYSI|nr:hypothetical protein OsI_21739 [Oryza sativa Indica Group]
MRPSIVLFGDSITEEAFGEGGWGAHLANHYSRSADVVLRGYSGYNTRYQYGGDCAGLPERTNESAGAYARACVEVAAECGLRVIDIWSKMQRFPGWESSFLRDGLHLTPRGNRVVFEEVVFALKDASLGLEALPADLPLFCDMDPNNPVKSFDE